MSVSSIIVATNAVLLKRAEKTSWLSSRLIITSKSYHRLLYALTMSNKNSYQGMHCRSCEILIEDELKVACSVCLCEP